MGYACAMTVLELIGNTPLIEVRRMDAGRCRLFLKLEHDHVRKGTPSLPKN